MQLQRALRTFLSVYLFINNCTTSSLWTLDNTIPHNSYYMKLQIQSDYNKYFYVEIKSL